MERRNRAGLALLATDDLHKSVAEKPAALRDAKENPKQTARSGDGSTESFRRSLYSLASRCAYMAAMYAAKIESHP